MQLYIVLFFIAVLMSFLDLTNMKKIYKIAFLAGFSILLVMISAIRWETGTDWPLYFDFFIHNNQNTDFSSSHIAELLYTSKATLSRFAKKIGYRGYQEFIYQYENTFEEKEEKITGNTKIVLNAYQEVKVTY